MFSDHPTPLNTWCAIAPVAHLLTGVYRKFLIGHFGDPNQLHTGAPNRPNTLLWLAGPKTGLVIESLNQWTPEVTNKRPGILICRNDCATKRIGIDDAVQGGVVLSGERYYANIVQGSHTLFCVSGQPTEAEIIAAETYAHIGQFAPALRQELGLMRLGAAGIGKLFELKEARGSYAVPVSVAFAGCDTWRLIPQAALLQRTEFTDFLP